ncbi:MAG: TonB-dependent receptor [Prevotellaceae bacterium]|jgi:TonB-linked SusC/RagA family outer membrane protein|nr:TonB-dependent receptor [Prevotellaceae bacterium]
MDELKYPKEKQSLSHKWRLCLLSVLLLFLAINLTAQTQVYEFDFKQDSYTYVFKQISEKTSYRFIYSNADIANLKPLTLKITANSISILLDKILENTELKHSLMDKDKTIVLSKKDKQEEIINKPQQRVNSANIASQEQITLVGKVIDVKNNEPMPFVSVIVKNNSNYGTSTDLDGNFSFQAPASAQALQISFLGYVTQDITIGTSTNFNIILEPDAFDLEEIIVVGYQTRKKSTLTGSIKALDAAITKDKPIASFDAALQGQVAGVYVMTSGNPGETSSMIIRGVTSLSNSTTPLFILDGVQISPVDFSAINPNDIESYTVLKDAAATSIYGAQAANGVILMTSKKGKDMNVEVRYNFQLGLSHLTRPRFTMMNTEQRLQYEEEMDLRTLDPSGTFYIGTNERKDSLLMINTDWRDEVFRDAFLQSHEISIRGGNNKTRYYNSLNFYQQDGTIKGSGFKRLSLRVNIDHNLSKYFNVGISSMLGYNKHSEVPVGSGFSTNIVNPVFASYALSPYLKARDDDGNLIDFQNYLFRNPVLYREMSVFENEGFKMVDNVYAEILFSDKLKFKANVGADINLINDYVYQSPYWEKGKSVSGYVSKGFSMSNRLTNTNLLTYINTFKKNHNVTVILGQETNYSDSKWFNASGTGLANDKIKMLSATAIPDSPIDTRTKWSNISYFGMINYNFQNKYFLDISSRRDGSSRFGPNRRWGNFWAVGASWQAKRERFLADNKTISLLTLTASTGTSGNANIQPYIWKGMYTFGKDYNYNNETGSSPSSPGNPSLQWEEVHKNNMGIEIGFWNRLRFKIEAYYNITNKMLLEAPISATTGFTAMQKNVGKLHNKGVEFEWDITLLANKDFYWKFNGNIGYNTTKVIKLTADAKEYDFGSYIVKENERFGLFYLARYAGVDPLTGAPLWYDKDGNLTNTCRDSDRVMLDKSVFPLLTGGFGTDMSYKNFSLSMFFVWMGERYMLSQAANFYNSNGRYKEYNQSVDMLNYWKKSGDVTPYPHPKYSSNEADTRYLEKASFLRLKDITLSYTLDPSYLSSLKLIRDMRLFIQARNLFTITPYNGFDPEVSNFVDPNGYPNSQTFTFGIDLTF